MLEFLACSTPEAWLERATREIPTLLIDHANCEKKAASTAISMTYRYLEHDALLRRMSTLAREELRHFEQVLDVMRALGVRYEPLSASRYAGALHGLVRKTEPHRLLDLLVLGAVVEARSCERFVALADRVPDEAASLYRALVDSEARHFEIYLDLAREIDAAEVDLRTEAFLSLDAELINSPDPEFRFHSGVPG